MILQKRTRIKFHNNETKSELLFRPLERLNFLQKASTKSNHLRFPKDSKTVFDSLRHSTENKYREVLKFIEQRTHNSSNLAMKIFTNHGRKTLPRQINHRKSPVIIHDFDHPNNERKKLRLTKLQKCHYCLEHLKSLNNKKFTRKIEQNHLHLLVPSVLFPQFFVVGWS